MRAGSAQPASPTTLAGTPATVVQGGTSFSTTDPAPTRAMPNDNVAKDLGTRADHHAAMHLGMAITLFLARSTEGNTLKDRNIIAKSSRFANHDPGGVIEENPFPNGAAGWIST